MDFPDVRTSIEDGALGAQPEDLKSTFAVVGCTSAGTPGRIYSFSNARDIVSSVGWGPAAELAAYRLSTFGGTVHLVKALDESPGAMGPVINQGRGPSGVSFVGTPFDRYDARVEIVSSGELGTAQFRYTLDGGGSYSPPLTVPLAPATYALPGTGLSVVFGQGTGASPSFVAGDTYIMQTTAPTWGVSSLNEALERLLDNPREWRHVHIVGNATPIRNGTTDLGTLVSIDSRMTQAEALYRYTYAIAEARDVGEGIPLEDEQAWIESLVQASSGIASKRIAVAAGHCLLQSYLPLPGKTFMRRSIAWPTAAQRAKLSISDDSGFAAKTKNLPGVNAIFHNAERIRVLDKARYTTARTIIGTPGFYCTHMRLMSPAGSDFQFVQHREIMDVACRVARQAFFAYFNADIPTNADGTIDEKTALQVEGYARSMLNTALSGHVTRVRVLLSRTDNVLSTNRVGARIRLRPKAYAKDIEISIGFAGPDLTSDRE